MAPCGGDERGEVTALLAHGGDVAVLAHRGDVEVRSPEAAPIGEHPFRRSRWR
jgi:hypothetical protein